MAAIRNARMLVAGLVFMLIAPLGIMSGMAMSEMTCIQDDTGTIITSTCDFIDPEVYVFPAFLVFAAGAGLAEWSQRKPERAGKQPEAEA